MRVQGITPEFLVQRDAAVTQQGYRRPLAAMKASSRLQQLAAQREGVPPGGPGLGCQAPVLPHVRLQHLLTHARGG